MRRGVSIHILLGCVVLAHCQRPPADDEDFAFVHEGSGRAVLAPPAGHNDPPPAPPASSGEVYGSLVSHHQPPPDYGSVSVGGGGGDHRDPGSHGGPGGRDDQAHYYGSGDGEDEYEYYDEYDGYEDYADGDDYYGSEDAVPIGGAGGQYGGGGGQYGSQPDHFVPEVVVPERRPDEDHSNMGVVHAAPPPLPEHTERPDLHYGQPGQEHRGHQQPPVYGTEIRPTEPPRRPEPEVHPEPDNGIELAPEVELHGRDGASENAIPDNTAGGQPANAGTNAGAAGLPDGMGSKAIDRDTSFFSQPGILAAVVGGAVVGLLCAILLVMLIVYRMRKKDEGSYALDEPKRSLTGNSYSKNYNKEFYA